MANQGIVDQQLESLRYTRSELPHHYGPNVHLLSDPFLHTQLSRLCSEKTFQPQIGELLEALYRAVLPIVVNGEFPLHREVVRTRMASSHPEGVFETCTVAPTTPVICVNLARAGTLPSHVCYSELNYLMNPSSVRQDHISIARTTDQDAHVTGSTVSGHKIGGRVDGAIVLFPDPMGATGGTIVEAMRLYQSRGKALKYIAVHCIVTPEYLKAVLPLFPQLKIYAIRLDRGLSGPDILRTPLGKQIESERGLNDHQYIVPGGGGFGEILNNSYV